jgi:TPP-dependent pyruvate/acetoin dehydrogenase alpha subunit
VLWYYDRQWVELEPLGRFRRLLESRGAWSAGDEAAATTAARKELLDAVKLGEAKQRGPVAYGLAPPPMQPEIHRVDPESGSTLRLL